MKENEIVVELKGFSRVFLVTGFKGLGCRVCGVAFRLLRRTAGMKHGAQRDANERA